MARSNIEDNREYARLYHQRLKAEAAEKGLTVAELRRQRAAARDAAWAEGRAQADGDYKGNYYAQLRAEAVERGISEREMRKVRREEKAAAKAEQEAAVLAHQEKQAAARALKRRPKRGDRIRAYGADLVWQAEQEGNADLKKAGLLLQAYGEVRPRKPLPLSDLPMRPRKRTTTPDPDELAGLSAAIFALPNISEQDVRLAQGTYPGGAKALVDVQVLRELTPVQMKSLVQAVAAYRAGTPTG
jgi:hypothetical protein